MLFPNIDPLHPPLPKSNQNGIGESINPSAGKPEISLPGHNLLSKLHDRLASSERPSQIFRSNIPKSQLPSEGHHNNFVNKSDLSQPKPDVNKESGLKVPLKITNEQKSVSIFGNENNITRREMRFKLKGDQKKDEFIRAERNLNLHMDRKKIAGLVEKYIPKVYKDNISKDEFRNRIRILDKTPVHDQAKRLQTRREIKLLKKIGGIE